MNNPMWSVRRLQTLDDEQIDGLADVLIDCVEGGASVSFMLPLTRERAVAYWRHVADEVAAGKTSDSGDKYAHVDGHYSFVE